MATITDALIPLADLRPNLKNYNRHDKPGQVDRMAEKIRHHGFTAPLVVSARDHTILGGHLRRLALLKLRSECYPEPQGIGPGWQVPCRLFEGTETQELAILAGDNPDPAEIDFDNAGLAAILSELQEAGELAGSGYSAERLDQLIGELAGESEGADLLGESGGSEGADEEEAVDAADTQAVIGAYRFPIPREQYLDWLEDIRQEVGFDDESVIAELRRRLGL